MYRIISALSTVESPNNEVKFMSSALQSRHRSLPSFRTNNEFKALTHDIEEAFRRYLPSADTKSFPTGGLNLILMSRSKLLPICIIQMLPQEPSVTSLSGIGALLLQFARRCARQASMWSGGKQRLSKVETISSLTLIRLRIDLLEQEKLLFAIDFPIFSSFQRSPRIIENFIAGAFNEDEKFDLFRKSRQSGRGWHPSKPINHKRGHSMQIERAE